MRPAVRRGLLFVVVFGTGLLLVKLLQDEPLPERTAAYGDRPAADQTALQLRDPDADLDVAVEMHEVDFDIYGTWTTPSGDVQRKPAYRVHVLDVRQEAQGGISVERPRLTALDLETGAQRGTLTALAGRLENESGLLEGLGQSFRNVSIESFVLLGEVRGDLLLADGSSVQFATEEVLVDEPLVRAPGDVTCTHGELELQGRGMSYDRDAGLLVLERDVQLTLLGTEPASRATLFSEQGLEWLSVPGGEARGHVRLRGPVTGRAEDGSALAADVALLTDEARSITLDGHAMVQRPLQGVMWTLTAASLTARRTEGDLLELTRAAGGVRLASDEGDASTWFETEQLDGQDEQLVATGPVQGGYRGLLVNATGLRLDVERARVELLADVDVRDAGQPGALLPDGRLASPGGLLLEGLPGARRLSLAGPVTAAAPGLGTLACAELHWDEHARELNLLHDVALSMALPTGERMLHADDVLLSIDEPFAITALEARGHVVLEQPDDAGGIARLSGSRVAASAGRLRATEEFELQWRGLRARGVGLDLDERQHHLEVAHAAHIEHGVEAGVDRVDAQGGLSWWFPEGESADPLEGHGALRGPVSIRWADGTCLSAAEVSYAGVGGDLELRGEATLEQPGAWSVRSAELIVGGLSGARTVRSRERVEWTLGPLSGAGTELQLDEARGRLRFERDVEFQSTDLVTGIVTRLSCDGSFQWTSPPGAIDAFRQGRGELRDHVQASDGEGGGLQADRVVLDMALHVAELYGECAVQRLREGRLFTLATGEEGFVRIQADAALQPEQFHARGRATLGMDDMRVEGDTLSWDVAADHVVLDGDCRLLVDGWWTSSPHVEVWPQALRWVVSHSVTVGGSGG